MTKREIKNLIANRYQQLHLMTLYKEQFVKKLGVTGYNNRIDDVLDEINHYTRELKKLD